MKKIGKYFGTSCHLQDNYAIFASLLQIACEFPTEAARAA